MKIRLLKVPDENHNDTYKIQRFKDDSESWELLKFPVDYRYDKELNKLIPISTVTSDEFRCSQPDLNLFYTEFKNMPFIKEEDGIKFLYKLRPKLESDKSTGVYPGKFTWIGYIPEKVKLMSLEQYLLSKSKVVDECELDIPE